MIDCIASAVCSESSSLVLKRAPLGAYDEHGRWVQPEFEELEFSGSVQPLNPDEIRRDDLRGQNEAVKIYTTFELRTVNVAESKQPDVIVWNGKEFEIYAVESWGSYFKALAVRKEQP